MIIDACIFSNELDILEIRFHELNPVVDQFVVVEALEPHGGSGKRELVFRDSQLRKEFQDKVWYLAVESLQPEWVDRHSNWPRENYHRNMIGAAINPIGLSDNDLVMISDCDEIPRAQSVKEFHSQELHSLSQDFFYYDVNNYLGTWHGTCLGTVRAIQEAGGPQAIRNRRDSLRTVRDAGWHFSYFGGLDRIRNKINTFAHRHDYICDQLRQRGQQEIIDDILAGRDLYHRPNEGRRERRSEQDRRLPSYLLNNLDRFHLFTEDGLRETLCKI